MCGSPRAVLPAGSVAAGCLQGSRMWIHGFLRAVPSAAPPLALQLPERRFSWRSPAPRDTESSRGWEWEGASALEGWLRKVEGETHLLQGPLWELLPLPDQIWQPRGRMGRKADEAQELFQELWERCPSGICHTVTGCCRTRAFTFCFLTPTGKSWSRFGPGRWRERRILCLGEQPSLSPLRTGTIQCPPWLWKTPTNAPRTARIAPNPPCPTSFPRIRICGFPGSLGLEMRFSWKQQRTKERGKAS